MQKTLIGTFSYNVSKLPVIEALQDLANREGIKLSPYLMRIFEDHVKVHKEGNPQHLITSSMDNEDFLGFPAIALSPENKRKYLKKMPEDMKLELQGHVQSWLGMIKES